ncbi:MAG: hypothetical protein WBD74_13845 [Candidatus Aquilonibacter sp.]
MEDVHDERPVLRALAIGEIFDRAVTMYVRNFVPFTLIVLTLLVPVGVLQYLYTDRAGESFAQLLRQMQHPGLSPQFDTSQLAALAVIALLVLLLAPFSNNAVAVGVAAIYAGRTPSYREGFARVLARWAPLLGTSILSMLILIGTYFALVIAFAIVAVVGVALSRGSVVLGVTFAIIAVVLLLAAIVVFIVLAVCCAFALYATTIEASRPADAIGEAFRRIFNRREFPKVVLISLAYMALEIGALILSGVIGVMILDFTHSTAAEIASGTVINAILTSFLTVLLAVYYYDVRTRTEGLDLEVALERLTAPA